MNIGGGIRSLAFVSAIGIAVTVAMTATTALHVAWPNAAFQLVGVAIITAVVVAHARRVAAAELMFMAGVVVASVPSLVIAAQHGLNHWDEFMTWLPNALYIWKIGGFPTAAAPPVASDIPGYPPGSSIVLAALWSLAGRVVDDAGPVLNVLCLMVLPGVTLQALGTEHPGSAVRQFGLGAMLGLAATALNVGLDWHWVLSSLPEVATLVAFAVAFVLGAECLFRRPAVGPAGIVALALILALIVNLRQTGVVLVGILIASSAVAAWICRADDQRSAREAAMTVALVLIPSLAVWACWHLYLSAIFASHAVSFRPLAQWSFAMLPTLIGAIGRSVAEHWLLFVPIAAVVARGWFVLGRRGAGGGGALGTGDRLAAIFALVEPAYLGFLVVCYIGAFADDEIEHAAEFFRYQAEVGGAGLLVAVVMAAERLRPPQLATLVPGVLALQLGAVWALGPAPGIYDGGVRSAADVAHIRQLGREAARLIADRNEGTDIAMVTHDDLLLVLAMRYELWASAPTRVVRVSVLPASDQTAAIADLSAAAQRASSSVALIGVGPHCGFYGDRGHAVVLPASGSSAHCLALLPGLDREEHMRSALRLDTATQ